MVVVEIKNMLDQNQFPMHISHHMLPRLIPKDISIWTMHVYMSNTCIYYLYTCALCKENKKFTKKSTQKKKKIYMCVCWNLQKLEVLESLFVRTWDHVTKGVAQSCMHPTMKTVLFHSIVGKQS
jgi:hypothetical protein